MPLGAAKTHNFQGLTDGSEVSTGFDQILGSFGIANDLGGAEMVLDFAAIATGVQSQYADTTAGDSTFLQITFDFGFSSAPSAAQEIAQGRNSTAKISNILANVSGGNPTLLARGGGDVSLTGWTAAVTLALNTRYRLQMAIEVGTSTTGKTKARLTRVSDGVQLASGERTDLNNGTTNTNRSNLGKLTSTGTMGLWIDNIAVLDSAYSYLSSPASGVLGRPSYVIVGSIPGTVRATTSIDGGVVPYTIVGSQPGVAKGAARALGVPSYIIVGSQPGEMGAPSPGIAIGRPAYVIVGSQPGMFLGDIKAITPGRPAYVLVGASAGVAVGISGALTTQLVTKAGTPVVFTAAAAGGDQAFCGRKNVLLVHNTDATYKTVSLVTRVTKYGRPVANRVFTVPAGRMKAIPLDEATYADAFGRAQVTYDNVANVSVAVIQR